MADSDQRAAILDLRGIAILLSRCILRDSFTVSDRWIQAIALTNLGERVAEKVQEKDPSLGPNDVRLATFLTFECHLGLLVDWLDSDLGDLRSVLSEEMRTGSILFPYIFGRELHDLAGKSYPETTGLDNTQTVQLLDQLPVGVFQYANTTVGPLGCLKSRQQRQMPPTKAIPGYLCSDESCAVIHPIMVRTATSRVGEARGNVLQVIRDEYGKGHDYVRPLIHTASAVDEGYFAMFGGPGLLDLVSDSFSVEETRNLAAALIRRRSRESGGRAELSTQLGRLIGNPDDLAADLDRPSLLQLLLLFKDREISDAIEECLEAGNLQLGENERLVAQVRRWRNSQNRLSTVVGPLGPMFESDRSSSLPAVRLNTLLHILYPESDMDSQDDLAYAMAVDRETVGTSNLVQHAMTTLSPDQIVDKLLIGNRKTAKTTADFLWIREKGSLTAPEFRESVAWKLGIRSDFGRNDREPIRARLEELSEVAGESRERIQETITPLFSAIETLLKQALLFTTWALTNDHYLSRDRFVYDPSMDFEALYYVDQLSPTSNPKLLLTHSNSTLGPLASGFSRLAKALKSSEPVLRHSSQNPPHLHATEREFAFRHTLPFFDLTAESQARLMKTAADVGRVFGRKQVLEVRNFLSHGNNPTPTPEQIRAVCDEIRAGLNHLSESGMIPVEWTRESRAIDALGRTSVTFTARGTRETIHGPEIASTPGMPVAETRMILFRGAQLQKAGFLQFVRRSQSGTNPYWQGYPRQLAGRSTHKPDRSDSDFEDLDAITTSRYA